MTMRNSPTAQGWVRINEKGDGSGTYYKINPTFAEIQRAWATAMGSEFYFNRP